MVERDRVRKRSLSQDMLFYIAVAVLLFAFLAVFSYFTSPFTNCDNGSDAAFFRLVGQGMTQGYLPYRDFFDMKGPFFFFIEYLGQLLSYGRLGIFILQWLNLFVSVVIICRLFDLYHISNRVTQLCLLVPLAYVAGITFEGGNLTEEFSLAELFSCQYLCLSCFKNRENPSMFWQHKIYWYAGLWYGFCFGLLLMIRITNTALICAMLLTVVLDLINAKRLRRLAVCASMFIAGLLVSVIPAIVFFGSRGLLGDMFEAVFVLGFRYSREKTLLQHIVETARSIHLTLLVIIPCLIPFVLHWRGWRERCFVLTGALFTFLSVASGNNYPHYYTLSLPLVLVAEIAVAEVFRVSDNRKRIVSVALSGIMLLSLLPSMASRMHIAWSHLFHQERYGIESLVQDISSRIPEDGKDSVFCYNLHPSWYTYADLFPCIRYCGWQNHYIRLMPEIYEDLQARFRTDPPAWLVLPAEKGPLPAFLSEMLGRDYLEYYRNESYALYLLCSKPS